MVGVLSRLLSQADYDCDPHYKTCVQCDLMFSETLNDLGDN